MQIQQARTNQSNFLAKLRERHVHTQKQIHSDFLRANISRRCVRTLLRDLSNNADFLLRQLWHNAALSQEFSLIALGGYGRKTLFPNSDLDVILVYAAASCSVLPKKEHSLDNQRIENFVSSCWDIGLNLGFSCRSVDQVINDVQNDLILQTAFLDARLLQGNRLIFQQLLQDLTLALHPLEFSQGKNLENQMRHAKYADTAYTLEPNCKETKGGLRDLHSILWIAKCAGLGGTWRQLVQSGVCSLAEAQKLQRCESDLSLIRARLHILAGRREDRLIFDHQTRLAKLFMGDECDVLALTPVKISERFMRSYYRTAKTVSQLHQLLWLVIEQRINPNMAKARKLNARFLDRDGLLEIADDQLYVRIPHAILETFLLYQTQPSVQGLAARTLRALYDAQPLMNKAFAQDPVNRATFLRILKQPSGITHVTRLMNNTSVLGRILPAFERIVGQMQYDLFHVYTVDQHTLMVLRNTRRFFIAEHAGENPFCSHLAAQWDKPWLLYLAALFHDIAKGRGGDHSVLGGQEVRRFCRQNKFTKKDTQLLAFLVEQHLVMSRVAQKQDVGDPEVVKNFATQVGNARNLTALYLLTVADMRGTGPKVWSVWKGYLLEQLYHVTMHAFGNPTFDAKTELVRRKRAAFALLIEKPLLQQQLAKFWKRLDTGYFMQHSADEMAWHAQAFASCDKDEEVHVCARESNLSQAIQISVYRLEQRKIFARICSYYDQTEYDIVEARIHTTNDGFVLDTFQVVPNLATPTISEASLESLEQSLAHYLNKKQPLPEPKMHRLSRRARYFPLTTRIELSADDEGLNWLLNISATDRSGLLYTIVWTLAKYQLTIRVAKIATFGERAENNFLIYGLTLGDENLRLKFERELLQRCSNVAQ